MAMTTSTVAETCAAAKRAARTLAGASTESKNAALAATARLLEERAGQILEANAADLADERAAGLSEALRNRLALSADRVAAMAEGVRVVAGLDDPVGEQLERKALARAWTCARSGRRWGRRRRLRGAPERDDRLRGADDQERQRDRAAGFQLRERSNAALAAIVREALIEAELPEDAVLMLTGGGREGLAELATQEGLVDLLIPRGGEGLKAALKTSRQCR